MFTGLSLITGGILGFSFLFLTIDKANSNQVVQICTALISFLIFISGIIYLASEKE